MTAKEAVATGTADHRILAGVNARRNDVDVDCGEGAKNKNAADTNFTDRGYGNQ
jgi:hypothetical protein